MEILLIDDEHDILELLKMDIKKEFGIDADSCLDGLSAFEKLKFQKFDVIVLDQRMPEMTGYELLKNLEGTDFICPKMEIIIFTAFPAEDYSSIRLKNNLSVLYKPLIKNELNDKLRSILNACPT